jgi:hypothetical protein
VLQEARLNPRQVLATGGLLPSPPGVPSQRTRDPWWRSAVLEAWDQQCAFCPHDGPIARASVGNRGGAHAVVRIQRTLRHRQSRSRTALPLRQRFLRIAKHVRSAGTAMIMNWLVTLLVATVPTNWDHSGLLQADIRHVNGPSRHAQTAAGAQQSRMACKRPGVRVPLAPLFREPNRDLVQALSAGLVATPPMR